jgi:hypothetical protein
VRVATLLVHLVLLARRPDLATSSRRNVIWGVRLALLPSAGAALSVALGLPPLSDPFKTQIILSAYFGLLELSPRTFAVWCALARASLARWGALQRSCLAVSAATLARARLLPFTKRACATTTTTTPKPQNEH